MAVIIEITFFAAFTIQAGFLAITALKIINFKASPQQISRQPISIIIAARNEYNNLKTLIPALLNQEYATFEVIIALDRCNDNSHELISTFKGNEKIRFISIETEVQGFNPKKYALTQAIQASSYEYLVFTDADCVPKSTKWLQSVNQAFGSNIQLSLGFSPYLKEKGLLNLFIRYETFVTAFQYLSFYLLGMPYMGVGRNLAFQKSLFLEVNGFDEHLGTTGGDDDLFVNKNATKTNTNVHVGPDALVYSKPKTTLKEFINQKTRHLSVGKYYKSRDQLLLGILAISQVVFWLTFIILATNVTNLNYLFVAIGVRWMLLVLNINKLTKLLGNQFEWLAVPLLDLAYTLYTMCIGPVGYFTKRIKWM